MAKDISNFTERLLIADYLLAMGTRFSYKCNNCDYKVMISAGHDFGMVAVTNTYICKSCKEIVDVAVGEYGKTFTKEEVNLKKRSKLDLAFYRCPECGSDKHLVKWNSKKRPCPRCDGKMEKDLNGEMILWD